MTALAELNTQIEQKSGELAKFIKDAGGFEALDAGGVKKLRASNDELTELGKQRDEAKSLADIVAQNTARLAEAKFPAQRMEHAGGAPTDSAKTPNPYAGKSLGQIFIESAAFKGFNRGEKRSPAVDIDLGDIALKGLMHGGGAETKTLLDTGGFAPATVRSNIILPGLLRRPVVADLMPDGQTNQNAIIYMEETTTTNGAAPTAEGALKPESALGFTQKTSNVRKIATVLPVTDELFDDAPAMRSYVEARLRVFLALAEEAQLLSGNGTAPNLRGILNTTGIQTQAKGTDPGPDALYKAMTLVRLAFLDPSGVVMHPTDWQNLRLLRTADGIYIWGSPQDEGPERVWSLPVVVTTAATAGTALVAAWDTGAQIFRRNEVSFAVSDQHSDFFQRNQLMLRLEERLALVVYRPSAFCTVTGL